MLSIEPLDPDSPEFVEVDPSGRYGRYNDILGKGASKTVYRAFDEYEGIEVAWNQVKLHDFLQSPEDLERLYCEIHLLKTLKHKNIMKFYTSWVDTSRRNINFITEMFTSGTLRQYRQKHRRVNLRAVKHWCRQILSGLLYLHSHDPPIIHRDLKCDNIFVNGNQGEVKIGDLGLAAILRKSHAVHCVGTPEFMAPEVYEEEYNELVDIYSFGMCVLEMVTFEYPYSECTHPVQIYKKVTSGTKPESLYRVEDPEMRQFIEKCLITASKRLSARELLKDPFLQVDDPSSSPVETQDIYTMDHILQQPSLRHIQSNSSWIANGFANGYNDETELDNGWGYDASDLGAHVMDMFNGHEDEHPCDIDITIKGMRRDDGEIFLRLRIADKDGRVRNIHFQFDIEADTALSVATEMVAELDITDHEVTRIAEMIDGEVASLVPGWKPGPGIEELTGFPCANCCEQCASNVSSYDSLLDFLSMKNPGHELQSLYCPHIEGAEMHGRFEEITYQGSEHCVTEGAIDLSSSQSDVDFNSREFKGNHLDEEGIQLDHLENDHKPKQASALIRSYSAEEKMSSEFYQRPIGFEMRRHRRNPSIPSDIGNAIAQELLKLNCHRQEHKTRVPRSRRVLHPSADFGNKDFGVEDEISGSVFKPLQSSNGKIESFHIGTHSFRIPENDAVSTNSRCAAEANSGYYYGSRPVFQSQRGQNCEANAEGSPDRFLVSLSRTKSLPVMQ